MKEGLKSKYCEKRKNIWCCSKKLYLTVTKSLKTAKWSFVLDWYTKILQHYVIPKVSNKSNEPTRKCNNTRRIVKNLLIYFTLPAFRVASILEAKSFSPLFYLLHCTHTQLILNVKIKIFPWSFFATTCA